MTSPILTNQHRQMEVLENLLLRIFFIHALSINIYMYTCPYPRFFMLHMTQKKENL